MDSLPTTSSTMKQTTIDSEVIPVAQQTPAYDSETLHALLLKQVNYYFSRKNISNDPYLVSHMNHELFVSISIVANFAKIKALTTDLKILMDVMKSSTEVVVDEVGQRVRPNFKLMRNTLILREIPSEADEERVWSLLRGPDLPPVKSVRADIGNTWFVTLENEEDAMIVMNHLRSQLWDDHPIPVRIKSENLLKSTYEREVQLEPNQEAAKGDVKLPAGYIPPSHHVTAAGGPMSATFQGGSTLLMPTHPASAYPAGNNPYISMAMSPYGVPSYMGLGEPGALPAAGNVPLYKYPAYPGGAGNYPSRMMIPPHTTWKGPGGHRSNFSQDHPNMIFPQNLGYSGRIYPNHSQTDYNHGAVQSMQQPYGQHYRQRPRQQYGMPNTTNHFQSHRQYSTSEDVNRQNIGGDLQNDERQQPHTNPTILPSELSSESNIQTNSKIFGVVENHTQETLDGRLQSQLLQPMRSNAPNDERFMGSYGNPHSQVPQYRARQGNQVSFGNNRNHSRQQTSHPQRGNRHINGRPQMHLFHPDSFPALSQSLCLSNNNVAAGKAYSVIAAAAKDISPPTQDPGQMALPVANSTKYLSNSSIPSFNSNDPRGHSNLLSEAVAHVQDLFSRTTISSPSPKVSVSEDAEDASILENISVHSTSSSVIISLSDTMEHEDKYSTSNPTNSMPSTKSFSYAEALRKNASKKDTAIGKDHPLKASS